MQKAPSGQMGWDDTDYRERKGRYSENHGSNFKKYKGRFKFPFHSACIMEAIAPPHYQRPLRESWKCIIFSPKRHSPHPKNSETNI